MDSLNFKFHIEPYQRCEFTLFCSEKECPGKNSNRETKFSCGLRRGHLTFNNKRIYLQSFFSKPQGHPFSVARWQPKGYGYKTINYLQPNKIDGSAIKKLPPDQYLIEYCKTLKFNFPIIKLMIENLKDNKRDLTFCCWCNSERQKQYEKLFCHTILIGYLFEKLSPETEVVYLDGRDKPVWSKEEFYKEMEL